MPKQTKQASKQEPFVESHFYSGIMGEAITALVTAHGLASEGERLVKAGDTSHSVDDLFLDAGTHARYAFLLACTAFENAAYTLLADCSRLSPSLVEELDRLTAINKFELFAAINGKSLDRGDSRYGKMKEVVRCRNEFVHPKGIAVPVTPTGVVMRHRGDRAYPMALEFLDLTHAAAMVGDILAFIAWVLFDVCCLPLEEGADLISRRIRCSAGVYDIAKRTWAFDFRSFGDTNRHSVCVTIESTHVYGRAVGDDPPARRRAKPHRSH